MGIFFFWWKHTEWLKLERRIQYTMTHSMSNALILPKLKAKLKLVKARTCTSAWLDLCWMDVWSCLICHTLLFCMWPKGFLFFSLSWNGICCAELFWGVRNFVGPGEENFPSTSAGTWTCDLSIMSPALLPLSYPHSHYGLWLCFWLQYHYPGCLQCILF